MLKIRRENRRTAMSRVTSTGPPRLFILGPVQVFMLHHSTAVSHSNNTLGWQIGKYDGSINFFSCSEIRMISSHAQIRNKQCRRTPFKNVDGYQAKFYIRGITFMKVIVLTILSSSKLATLRETFFPPPFCFGIFPSVNFGMEKQIS